MKEQVNTNELVWIMGKHKGLYQYFMNMAAWQKEDVKMVDHYRMIASIHLEVYNDLYKAFNEED